MQYHEAANIFPMDEDNIHELADDIRAHGLLQPIEIFEGKILDGRRRSAACLLAGVEPDYSEVNPVDPVAYVLSLNLHRRHLSEGQRAMVADKVKEYHAKRAKDRMSAGGGDKKSAAAKSGKANRPYPIPSQGQASDQIGEILGVGGRTVRRAGRVRKEGTPEVVQAVESGKLSLSKAEQIVTTHPKEQQAEAVKDALENKPKPKERTNENHGLKPHRENTVEDSRRACETIEHAVAELEKMKLDTLNAKDAATLHDDIFALRTRITRIITSLKDNSNGEDHS